jgi:alanyl-tRNA synthetase
MKPNTLRRKYLDFFIHHHHAEIPSAPIVPENDPTTLFTGSGMQPLINYFLGEKHPQGSRITNSQRCFRSQDIEEVGDNRHTTYFEMLGNWSFGDYFKKEQLSWFFTFLTKELKISPDKLYVTVYQGDSAIGVPRDSQSVEIWQDIFQEAGIEAKPVENSDQKGMQDGRIFYFGHKNWWSRAGEPGKMPDGEPGGPDSEVFYDVGSKYKFHENSPFKDQPCHVNCDCGRFLEIGNSVFMQYQKTKKGFEPLPSKNVDFGGGLERILAVTNDDPDIFKTELFQPIIQKMEELSGQKYDSSEETKASFRVVADHMRSAVMLALDGIYPSNKEQGYFSRRLLRRAIRFGKMIGIERPFLHELVPLVIEIYQEPYPELKAKKDKINQIISDEENKFRKTLDKGLREFEKLIAKNKNITGEDAFKLFETYGFPFEITQELAKEQGVELKEDVFQKAKTAHADASRTASAGKFKGGLADHSEKVTKLHTATHLLNQALRETLGNHVQQAGSNITGERLRFDFSHPQSLTQEQKQAVEELVNQKIQANLEVTHEDRDTQEALDSGAVGVFGERYGDKVKVYSIGDFSKEICGGPHVERTGVLGKFTLGKEKSIGSGKRRIYGYLS